MNAFTSVVVMVYQTARSTVYIRTSRAALSILTEAARSHPKVRLLDRMLDAAEMTDKFAVEMIVTGGKIIALAVRQFIYPTYDDAVLANVYQNRVNLCYREMARWTKKAHEYSRQLSELE